MAVKLYKYKKKLKKKLKKIKIISGMKFRDLVVVILVVVASWIIGAYVGTGIFNLRKAYDKKENKTVPIPAQTAELNPESNPESYVAPVDTVGWKSYRSQKYEFEIKYPKEWPVPKEEYLSNYESGYEYKISFNSFNILIRDSSKSSPSPSQKCNSKENNSPKYILTAYQSNYAELNETPAENNSCAIKEIRILKNNFYFKKVFVYHIVKGKYSYDIVPMEKDNSKAINYVSVLALNEASPELDEVLSTFKFKSADPIISRPRIVYAVRISCAEKNDHPSNSDTKGKHMDEDCCPDPDEWPKPSCAYSASGYAVMISSPKK